MDTPAFVDERQDVQKKTFTKWINSQLSKAEAPLVTDLFEDLRDGHKLLSLLEILTNKKYKREKGRMRVHHINNVNKVLQVLNENGVKLLNISSEDIVGGNPKLTLGLISMIALCFDGQKLLNSETASGLEKNLLRWVRQFTDKYQVKVNDFTTSWSSGLAFLYILHDFGIDFDLEWAIKQHPIARLRLAFDLATRYLQIDSLLDPEDVNTNKPDKKSILMYVMCLYKAIESIRTSRLSNAASIQMLDQHFEGSTEEINSPTSDDSSQPSTSKQFSSDTQTKTHTEPSHEINLTDLDEVSLAKSIEDITNFPVKRSSTFTIIKNESINLMGADNETLDVDDENNKTNNFQTFIESHSRPVSTATNVSVEIGGYQNAIEIVLSLLLEAEEVLSKPLPEIKELSEAKAHFQAHEEFMIKLSEYQEYVGGALEEGARLLSEPMITTGLTAEDQSEIKQQMLLLNERWELLRVSALDVQSRVHACLAQVQMQKIEELRVLLTNSEDRISRMPEIDPKPDAMPRQIKEHKELEASLNEQKVLVDDLSNLVVIVNDDSFNDLEDRLAALGERWTHVVTWTKNRFQKLQDAHWNWKLINRKFVIMNEWINVRENDLKQMESQDVSAIGSVMERMQNLRFCAMDLNVLYDSLNRLEEIAQGLQPASEKLLEKLENVLDRCEALKEIVDVQQQRIEGMGFDFNVDILDNVKLPTNWTDFQAKLNSVDRRSPMELGESDEFNQSDNELDDSPQSNKKRKLQKSEKYQQLNACLKEMDAFVTSGEQQLIGLKEIPTLKEQGSALEKLQNQLKVKINEYPNIKTLLNDCVEDDGHDLPEEATEISNIGTKYDELNFRIEHMLELNEKASIKEKFCRNLTGLKLVLADCQDWFKQYANLNASTQEELENRLAYMQSLSSDINEAQNFYRNTDDKSDLSEWKSDFDQFHHSWNDIESAIKRLLHDNFDTEPIDEQTESQETTISPELEKFEAVYVDSMATCVVGSNLDKMRGNLHHLNELKSIISEVKLNDEIANNPIESEKWEKLESTIEDRILKQTTAIENLIHFTTEFEQVVKFLSNLEKSLADDLFMLGEEDELKQQEKSYESIGMEIKKVEIDIISVKNFSEVIVRDSTDGQHKAILLSQVQSVNDLYTSVKKTFQSNNKALKQALEQTSNIYQRINEVELWLNELEKSTPTTTNAEIETSNQLFQIRNKFQSLKETCEQKTVEFRELLGVGSEMLLRIDEQLNQPNCKCKYSTLARHFTKLNAKWNEVTTLVYNRTALLEHISSQLGELKTLIVSESGYMDKLEKCLRKGPDNAADAEEIYEELDDLENSIRNHSEERLDKIKELGNELIEHECMAASIMADVKSVTDRWNLLQHKGKQRQTMLEKAVSEAQSSESRVQSFQHWIHHVDELLNEHLDNDTTADDLPHDFSQRLVEEFDANEKVLNEMKEEVELYQQKGKTEAAHRMREQVNLLEERFQTSQTKLNAFTSPQANFEGRLNRAMGELRAVERSSCILDISSAAPNNVQDQYKHCLKMYRTLSEVKTEIENVIKTGRKICDDKTTKYAKKLTLSIDALKHLYNSLGEHVTQSKVNLEKLLRITTAIQSNITAIERWLNFFTELNDEIMPEQRNKLLGNDPVLMLSNDQVGAMLEKCNVMYSEYCEICDPTYLEDLHAKIDSLSQQFIRITVNDVGKDLLEIKSTLQNLDNISIDTLRSIETDLKQMNVSSIEIQKLHQQVTAIVQDALSSRLMVPHNGGDVDDMEIVVVSDTVRQRRSRTPSTSATTIQNDNIVKDSNKKSNVMPDLLPKTFHLAETSALFSQVNSDSENLLTQQDSIDNNESKVSIVEIRETNLSSPKRVVNTYKSNENGQIQNIGQVLNTCSILESVSYLEPSCCVETVHIIDATSEPSDSETPCSTPNLGDRHDSDDEDDDSDENEYETGEPAPMKQMSYHKSRGALRNERNLLKESEQFDNISNSPSKPQRKKLTPTLKDILSATSDRDSFYSADKEVFDEPLTFSDDDDSHHLGEQTTENFNRDTDRIAKPNAGKPAVMHERKLEHATNEDVNVDQSQTNTKSKTVTTTTITTTSKTFAVKKMSNSTSLSQRVYEFEKTARYMIKKLQETREKIEASIAASADPETIEHLKLLVAPDAATLISQGDSLVLETHGNTPQLANTVMEIQSILREKFREVQHSRLPSEYQKKDGKDLSQELENYESKAVDAQKIIANDIDEGAKVVCNKAWTLFDNPVDEDNELQLNERLADIQSLQTELKIQWKFASQATPSPKAKATMETLDRTRSDLSYHYDSVVQSLKKLNNNSGLYDNDDRKYPDGKPVDKKVQNEAYAEKKENSSESSYVPGSFSAKGRSKLRSPNNSSTSSSATPINLDKAISQITDWLNLDQNMAKNYHVDVCDIDAIQEAINKQKTVVRELEYKKPQLDELILLSEALKTDGNRQKLHSKINRLREHWDETSQSVLQRKSQLTNMLGDSQRYEAKRLEIEKWLQRMESRFEQMGKIATTADVLEAQQKEQKSFHAELHQYKYHVELFNQLTQKLIAVYPTDDTSRIKRMTEAVNIRYNNLNNVVINRGKLLQTAVHSLQLFDRSMDQFLAWLSEAESLCENAEQEIERNPLILKVCFFHFYSLGISFYESRLI